tara:strand:+ start:382 stop:1305 length:924 start_codon:yes stop_codon:yes gene_type:complete
MDYKYLIDKIHKAEFSKQPFKQIYIEDFFNESDFEKITNSNQISLDVQKNDYELHDNLIENGYEIISFPGTTSNFKDYARWHKKKSGKAIIKNNKEIVSSLGIVYRLSKPNIEIKKLFDFINSEEFNRALANKFEINFDDCKVDNGIQKYLDGYEISPHPDIRRKALTFMVNINPNYLDQDYNTHYLEFKPEFKYIQNYWAYNKYSDRCWVPWSWCETKKIQNKNNSIVIFSPGDDTMHAVKADYNHLTSQRTQLYGNLWYKESNVKYRPQWIDLRVKTTTKQKKVDVLLKKVKNSFFKDKTLKRNN